MRLFIALELSPTVRENLAALIESLRAISPQPRWVRAENLHVTLKFLGEVPEGKLEAIRNALGEIRSEQPVTMEFRGLGFFPDDKYPRVLWVNIEASANLKKLAADIENAVEKVGIPREQRAFSAHLTLARFNSPGLPEKLRSAIAENAQREFGAVRTNEFHLIQSELKSSGAQYTTLARFPFAAAET